MEIKQAIHCLKNDCDEEVCEECDFYHNCTHETRADVARLAVNALEKQMPNKIIFNSDNDREREAAQKLIDEQPTVYDVDKAVERLEQLIKKSYRMAVEGSHWAGAKYNAYREALEIVKAEIKKQEPEGGKKGNEKHADRFKQLFI